LEPAREILPRSQVAIFLPSRTTYLSSRLGGGGNPPPTLHPTLYSSAFLKLLDRGAGSRRYATALRISGSSSFDIWCSAAV
jgi:hypothetical protein